MSVNPSLTNFVEALNKRKEPVETIDDVVNTESAEVDLTNLSPKEFLKYCDDHLKKNGKEGEYTMQVVPMGGSSSGLTAGYTVTYYCNNKRVGIIDFEICNSKVKPDTIIFRE